MLLYEMKFSQSEKEKYQMISLICGILNDTNELIYKAEIALQTIEDTLTITKEEMGGIN